MSIARQPKSGNKPNKEGNLPFSHEDPNSEYKKKLKKKQLEIYDRDTQEYADGNIPVDYRFIEENPEVQDQLKKLDKEKSPEEVFEKVWQNYENHGQDMIDKRELRRLYQTENGIKEEPSFLDTKEKEREFYDDLTKKGTTNAMNWLKREKAREKNKGNEQDFGI